MADFKNSPAEAQVTCDSFDNLLNFRDVGKFMNELSGEKVVKEGLFFRSARPDDATIADRRRLEDEYQIKTVMDLRTKSEHIKQRDKRTADLQNPEAIASNPALSLPMKLSSANYLEINLNGKGFERSLLWKLSFLSFIKLVFFMAIGKRIRAISILGREVMNSIGLTGLAFDTLDHSGPEIKTVMQAFAEEKTYPVLVHCTQGKDRTGLIVALVLFLLDMKRAAIEKDYVLSEKELEPERKARMVEISEIGLGEEFAGCPLDWIKCVDNHLKESYGGTEKYLESIGVDARMRDQIKSVLRA